MDGDPIALRAETGEDEALSLAIYGATRADEMAMVSWTDEQKQGFLRMQFEAQRAHYRAQMPDADYSIVEVGGEAVGRLYVDRRADEIRIVDVALLPHARGKGIGKALLDPILEEARARGLRVSLHVEPDNPARAWYDRLGFEVVGEAGAYLKMEWSPS
jgi:ribosomal protein S18 acetylase RimI-like enzyme